MRLSGGDLADHHQFIPNGPAGILITVFQSRTRKETYLDDVPHHVKRRKTPGPSQEVHATFHGGEKTQRRTS